jgi:hypothetical protein
MHIRGHARTDRRRQGSDRSERTSLLIFTRAELDYLAKQHIGRLATVSPDGRYRTTRPTSSSTPTSARPSSAGARSAGQRSSGTSSGADGADLGGGGGGLNGGVLAQTARVRADGRGTGTGAAPACASRHAWNGSWNAGPESPSVLGAVALSCDIGAGSGGKARGHASCKRQVSGSNPLTGSRSP